MKILVSGANGQLGSELQFLAKSHADWEWMFTDFEEMDITNPESLEAAISSFEPDYFINGAAYTAVDKAEEEAGKAQMINAEALKHITKICNVKKCFLIHISSDYVYHNNPGRPLQEDDPTEAQGQYARTKLEGDQIVMNQSDAFIIIRTSWVYSVFGNNFVKTMLRLGADRDALSIVSDQIGSPSNARDIAQTIIDIIDFKSKTKNHKELHGVYNYSNSGVTNWAEFAEAIFEIQGLEVAVTPISTEQFNAPAPRPKWSYMNKEKIQSTFGIELIPWKESLSKCLEELNAN